MIKDPADKGPTTEIGHKVKPTASKGWVKKYIEKPMTHRFLLYLGLCSSFGRELFTIVSIRCKARPPAEKNA
jgi:hypothetical protein